ncbi:bestrophin-like domain [Paraburkholderia adhaesiva]|uniref:bestrophin-like domain n=1 Tax=Paraburkholderia adhaesiva TaxID=2883244 RepID=UPI004032B4C9
MIWIINTVAHLSDFAILAAGGISTAVIAAGIAWGSARVLEKLGLGNPRSTIADVVHGSLLAFIVFVLAHVLTDVRANEGRAADDVLREASFVARLDRQLRSIGGADGDTAREALRLYVMKVAEDDWPALAAAEPDLSPRASEALDHLVNVSQRAGAYAPAYAEDLQTLLREIEDSRQKRLENATRTVPRVFWWVIWVFLLGAMVMNGRFPINRATLSVIALHMAAIGMVVALIVILDEPYRGQSAISPVPLEKAIHVTMN